MAFNVENKEGIKFQFTPNKKSLHVLDCKDYFGVGNNGCMFGKKNNAPTIEENSFVPNGIEGITTIEGNKKNSTN